MSARGVLYGLLLIVAAAAAVLSFSALRDLALVCGFGPRLAWLLPVVVDAGAAAGSLVWLGGPVGIAARRFARALALGLLGLSVAANALGHGLAAFDLAPAWWVVVAVSAVAPAVLGAVVHLAVLVGRPDQPPASDAHASTAELTADLGAGHASATEPDDGPIDELVDEHGLSRWWDTAPPAFDEPRPDVSPEQAATEAVDEAPRDGEDRAAELIAAGAGRRRLSRELGLTEYEARRLLERTRRDRGPGGSAGSSGSVAGINGVTVGGQR